MKNTISILIVAFLSFSPILDAQVNWDIKDFHGVDITGNINVVLEKGTSEAVKIMAPNSEFKGLDVYVDRNGILKLQALKSLVLDRCPIKISITYIELNSIKGTAGAEIISRNVIAADDLWIKAGSGAQIELTIEANSLEAKATEGGELELKGKVNTQYAFAATGGEYDGLDLLCAQTQARANTGGEVMVNASESLTAKATTGAVIEYLGDAKIHRLQTGLSGKVTKLQNKGMRVEWN